LRYLLDTNIISEVRKGARCDPQVASWFAKIADDDIYLSVLVLGEIRKGIERAKAANPRQAAQLEAWLVQLQESFADRILSVDQAVADEWGRMSARRSVSTVDALLAATARVHCLKLATRNVGDVTDLGADIFNPFAASTNP
jgi:predicted nucleic acid-binding protein